MSSSSNKQTQSSNVPPAAAVFVPVGIDLGSLNARVAIASSSSAGPNNSGSCTYQIVSNLQGQRATVALSTVEHHHAHDDGADAGNGGKTNGKEPHVIFGDAARRSLQIQRRNMEEALVSNVIRTGNDGERRLAEDFFGHLCQLACDATSSNPCDLRCVVSVPVATLAADGASSEEGESGGAASYVESIVQCLERGVQSSLSDNDAPPGKGGGATGKKKSGKKQQQGSQKKSSNMVGATKRNVVVGVITDAAAACVAHGLTDEPPTSDDETLRLPPPPDNLPSKPKEIKNTWKTCLVIDWGASGLTVTKFHHSNNILTATKVEHEPSCSGRTVTSLLCKHLTSMFERKARLPATEVLSNRKAMAKLTSAAEEATKTLSAQGTTSANVSIDGLYEGVDLHVSVSRPRFEMLMGPLLRKAGDVITKVIGEEEEVDVVLKAGNVCDMPCVASMIGRRFTPDVWKGDETIPVDEVVAIGCAKHAAAVMASGVGSGGCAGQAPPKEEWRHVRQATYEAEVSPVGIGVALAASSPSGDDDGTAVLDAEIVPIVRHRTPLPITVSKKIEVANSGCGEDTRTLLIVETVDIDDDVVCKKTAVVARIPLPSDVKDVNLWLDLDACGQLSMSVDGGDVVTVG